MSFHRINQNHLVEVSEPTFHRLMHQLTMAGAQQRTSYGSGRAGNHPDLGNIAAVSVRWPARVVGHPPVGFFAESANEKVRQQLKAA